MNKTCLVARPVPIHGESPASVLIRAVDGNGYPNLQALMWAHLKKRDGKEWAKASYVDPARYSYILAEFGIDMPPEALPAFARSGPTSETARLLDSMEIPEKLFRDDARFYCPDCLRERKYWRKTWLLRPFSVCPVHHRFLIKDCPACGAELHSWRGKLAECDCGANLLEVTGEPADPAALEWWLDMHRNGEPSTQAVDATILALSCFDGSDDTPQSEFRRLEAARDWFVKSKVARYLQDLVSAASGSIHPRIQVLPLLRSDHPEIRSLAQAILSSWMPCRRLGLPTTGNTIQAREAELALGISRFQLMAFREWGLLDRQQSRGNRISLDDVNRILFAMHAAPGVLDQGDGRKLTESVASMVLDALSGARPTAGYDITQGLATLRLAAGESRGAAVSSTSDEWLDVNEIAGILGTYPDAVRFLTRKGWIPFRDRDLANRKRLIASRTAVDEFNRKYVLAGVLAKQLAVNPTNLAEKLMSLGAKAVSGPSVDGTLVYLFRREEVECLDPAALKNLTGYQTKAGRKPKASPTQPSEVALSTVTAAEAAATLGINVQQLQSLFKRGILQRVASLDRAVKVDLASLEELRATLDRRDLITVAEAAARLNQPPAKFERLWVKRGVIKVLDLGRWRLVRRKDLIKLRCRLNGRVTAAEAGRLQAMHRSHFPNMERHGKVRSVKLGKKNGGIRLYALRDVEARGLPDAAGARAGRKEQ